MDKLTLDCIGEILLCNHPYYSIELCKTNKYMSNLCKDKYLLRQLMKKWLFPGVDIPNTYPIPSFVTIAEYALFYYPIYESMGKYHPLSLYYRSTLVYYEEDCRQFADAAIAIRCMEEMDMIWRLFALLHVLLVILQH